MGKIKAFQRLKNKDKAKICRVSDLIAKGFDMEKLSEDFVRLNREVWGDITDSQYLWTKEMIRSHFQVCPQHIYCAFENGVLVASLTTMLTTAEDMQKKKTWLETTGNGYLSEHRPAGNIGFGVDLSVSRKASRGVSDRIVLVGLVISLIGGGVQSVYLGARIPGYHKHAHTPVMDYVFRKRRSGKPIDPELYFYLKQGFQIVEIIPEYMEDPESLNYGVLIRWKNPLYRITRVLPLFKSIIKSAGRAIFLSPQNL